MNPELQNFVDQEKREKNGIDPQELQTLEKLTYDDNKELSQEALKTLNMDNSRILVNQIQNFLQSDAGKTIDQNTEKNYINILNLLNNINKNVYIKADINIIKNNINEIKISTELTKLLIENLTNEKGEKIKLLDDDIMSDMITKFLTQQNKQSPEQLNNKLFGPEELQKLPNEQKDALASKLAQIIFRKEQVADKRDQTTQKESAIIIKNYRQQFFDKCFKDGDVMPMLLDQKMIILGDRAGTTKGLYKGDSITPEDQKEYSRNNVGGFSYENSDYTKSNNTINRKPGQDTLDIAMLADGVDVGGVDFTIQIGDTTLKGYTKGMFPDKAARDTYMTLNPDQKKAYEKQIKEKPVKDENIIIRENNNKIPDGISIKNGGIHIDATKLGQQPQIKVDIDSPEKNDETFVTINTNGKINESGEVSGTRELNQQNFFANGLHAITEIEAGTLNTTIKDIQTLINESRISTKGDLVVNIDSTTDKSAIVESLRISLNNDLAGLEKSFLTTLESKYGTELGGQKFTEIQSSIQTKTKDRPDSDGNKALAQCRAYQGMQYIINNLGSPYINQVKFNINNIQGNQEKRSFSLKTTGETIKRSTKTITKNI